jgi:hypothetical protein
MIDSWNMNHPSNDINPSHVTLELWGAGVPESRRGKCLIVDFKMKQCIGKCMYCGNRLADKAGNTEH